MSQRGRHFSGGALDSDLRSRPRSTRPLLHALLLVAFVIDTGPTFGADAAEGSSAEASSPASVRVTGLGWWKNRELRQMLRLLEPEDARMATLDAALIEDGVVLLQSALERDGFLQPSGRVELQLHGEPLGEFPWSTGEVPAIPRELRADRAVFILEPGVRFTFEELEFTGLTTLRRDAARLYFLEEGLLFGGGGARRFTPGGLRRGVENLREDLIRRGHADAHVEVHSEDRDPRTGDVAVNIAVMEGPMHHIGAVTPPEGMPEEVVSGLRRLCDSARGARYSPLWQQDFVQAARRIMSEHGYADARVQLVALGSPVESDLGRRRDFQLSIQAGLQIHVGDVRFTGYRHTHESVLRRATHLDPGDLFDSRQVDEDRQRLGSLGIFSSVQTRVEKRTPSEWDLLHELKLGRKLEVSLLAGYGSYEQLRGGIEVFHANLLGQAHRGRLQLIVSQKTVSGDYLYTVPQVFGTTTDVSARLFGLQREEVSFDREELGVSVGARRRIEVLRAEAALRYQFESVRADVFDATAVTDAPTNSRVASLTFDLTRDRLDNPISPRRGHFLAFSLETATKAMGGEVDYQRLDLRSSWHRRAGRGKHLHVGIRHGLVWALNGLSAEDIPLARRYFPGGEGTVRGYTEGRASPRAADGNFIGAEVSTIINAEFERDLARNLSAVVFVDIGVTAARLADYPGDQTRVSVGLGLRYNTVIGPARLEYGRNVFRESGDGTDAWHLSLGFPF